MNGKKTALLFSLFLTILLLSACGGGPGAARPEQGQEGAEENETAETGNGEGGGQAEQQVGIPVKVIRVKVGEISTSIPATSTVEAEKSVGIYARVEGVISKLNVEEGKEVSANYALCELEDEELRTAEVKAKSKMQELQRRLDNVEKLLEEKVATKEDLEAARYNHEQTKLEWEQAKIRLDYAKINSTIDGIVFERLINLGDKVSPGTKVFSVFDPQSLVAKIDIHVSDYYQKVRGREKSVYALLSSDSLPGEVFRGGILRVSPVVNQQTNTIKITLSYKDPSKHLRPGMFVQVKLITDTHTDAILIDKDAIMYEESLRYVFLARDGEAKRVNLDVGFTDDYYMESLAEIRPDDLIVIRGQKSLKSGVKVNVTNIDEVGGAGEGERDAEAADNPQ